MRQLLNISAGDKNLRGLKSLLQDGSDDENQQDINDYLSERVSRGFGLFNLYVS